MPQPYNLLPKGGTSLADEWLDIGLQHHIAGRAAEAEQAYVKGLRVDPNFAPIIVNLGVMAGMQGNTSAAVQRLERATMLADEADPRVSSVAWYNYALALLDIERNDEAIPAIKKSIKFGESAQAYAALGMILTSAGLAVEAAEAYDKAMDIDPKNAQAGYNAIFVRTLKHTTPEENCRVRKRWYDANKVAVEARPHANDRTASRKLRVGYVGGDFKMHSAAFIFGAVVLEHDKSVIEPYCYMSMPADPSADAKTKEFMEKTVWRDIAGKTDEEADAMIRADQIDILVDLSGHTGGNRLTLFMRKPAPVQCHAWGFAHGSGCPEVDYFLADEYAIPKAERGHFAEKIWDLPSIVGFAPPSQYNLSGSSPAPVTREGVFTFGVFGRFEKMSPESLEAWHKILLRTPGSRLMLKDALMRCPYVIRRIRGVMHDVDPKRVLFMQNSSHFDQMQNYQAVDLALDTFPHTGGVTGLEMLYMGVPVVSLYNGQVGGRTPSVALRAIGRQDWIAESVDEYVRKAVTLATDGRAELAKARGELREELLKSPLCNPRYVGSVEEAYRGMWRVYCGVEDGKVISLKAAAG